MDLGEVPYLRSQTIYHAVANALDDDAPDTIVLMSPREPYACIGYHQDLEREIDLGYCRAAGLPVLRREIGGGTVYLDGNQLFYHCIFNRRRVPRHVDDIYRLFLRGPIETYRQLGIEARLFAVNDIVAGDRKIGGTGAGTIGEAVVVCGSIIFDFDYEKMGKLLRTPSQAFQEQVERNLRRYVTSLKRELGRKVPRDHVRDLLVAQFGRTLGVKMRRGEITEKEWSHVERLDSLFLEDEWLYAVVRPATSVKRVKIRAGVSVCEASHRCDGRYARVTLSIVDGKIDNVDVGGDLDLIESQLESLETALLGQGLPSGESGGMPDIPANGLAGSSLTAIRSCLRSIGEAVRENS